MASFFCVVACCAARCFEAVVGPDAFEEVELDVFDDNGSPAASAGELDDSPLRYTGVTPREWRIMIGSEGCMGVLGWEVGPTMSRCPLTEWWESLPRAFEERGTGAAPEASVLLDSDGESDSWMVLAPSAICFRVRCRELFVFPALDKEVFASEGPLWGVLGREAGAVGVVDAAFWIFGFVAFPRAAEFMDPARGRGVLTPVGVLRCATS